MAPWKILHWRSPILFFRGGLYNGLHCGLSPASLSVHTHSALSYRCVLWIVFTSLVYRVFLLALCRLRFFSSLCFSRGSLSSVNPGHRWIYGYRSVGSGSASPLLCLRRRTFSLSVSLFFQSSRLLCIRLTERTPSTELRAQLSRRSCCVYQLTHADNFWAAQSPISPGTVLQHTSSLAPQTRGSFNNQYRESHFSLLLLLNSAQDLKATW